MDKKSRMEKSKAYRDDKYIKSWLVGLSERTQANYLEEFSEWYAFMGMTPTQMIEKRLKDTRSDNLAERMFFEQKFREYKQHLEDFGTLSPIAIRTQLTPVASFFSRNGLKLNLKRGDWESNKVQIVKTARLKLEKEDIKAMYTHGGTRDRALLLVLAQSGFSEVDVSNFKIEDMLSVYSAPETEHFYLEKRREKTGEDQAIVFKLLFSNWKPEAFMRRKTELFVSAIETSVSKKPLTSTSFTVTLATPSTLKPLLTY
jgi:hypothetical protein